MARQLTQNASELAENVTQNVSDTVTTGTQISSDLAVGASEYVSAKVENVVNDFADATAEWADENSKFFSDQVIDMASTASLFGNLARSASAPVEDETGKDRLKQFGDPSAKVHAEKTDDEYVPRKLRRYM